MKFKTIRPAAVAAIAFIVVHFLFVCPPLFAMTCREFYQEFIFRQLKQSEIEILTRFAYEPDVYRSSSDRVIWLQFKNGPNEKPQTVDLSNPKLNSSWPIGQKDSPGKFQNFPLLYEAAVLSLKQGDTVRFGLKTFKLGEFLGNGNASHIFALAHQPDTHQPEMVIKIPFLAANLANPNSIKGFQTVVDWRKSHYDRMLEVNRRSFLALEKERNDILTDADFRYILMPRIRGSVLASDFLDLISRQIRGRGLYAGESFYLNLEKLPADIDGVTRGRLLDLIGWMKSRGYVVMKNSAEGDVHVLETVVTRQLMLSDQGKWEVLDAE
ncbi:MAG: hypothetical protein JNL11_10475 [Bdellovibrionaceae bacterium]|nr:hypothetical protein [Pseudobdellovibrionaceae bacterium]